MPPDDTPPPILPPPNEAALQRAKPLFDRLVGEIRAADGAPPALALEHLGATAAAQASPVASAEAPPPVAGRRLLGGRRYDLATSLLPTVAGSTPALTLQAAADPPPPQVLGAPPVPVPKRPPPGAPAVRGPVGPALRAAPVAEALLAQTAQAALLRSAPDGSLSFDIAFSEAAFCEMACTISIQEGRTRATFRVSDPNARRLLEAEAGRLRVGLEARGLKVDRVEVVEDRPGSG
jgi:flagellar hook-length control protein FliK